MGFDKIVCFETHFMYTSKHWFHWLWEICVFIRIQITMFFKWNFPNFFINTAGFCNIICIKSNEMIIGGMVALMFDLQLFSQ